MGVRVTRPMSAPTLITIFDDLLLLVFFVVVSLSCIINICAASDDDSETLLKFKESLTNAEALYNWDPSVSPCNGKIRNWVGVLCLNGNVRGLQLENMGLKGVVNVDSLISLTSLRTLSFMNNTLVGPWPHDVNKLSRLRSLYLSYNHISGDIPDDAFTGMKFLKKVLLNHNEFTGKLPSSLATSLPRLMELRVDANKFEGQIPEFQQHTLKRLNVSHNALEGPIPSSLTHMDSTSFSDNENLCGPPLELCTTSPPLKRKSSFLFLKISIAILVVGIILVVMAAIFFIFFHLMKKKPSQLVQTQTSSTTLDDHQNKYVVASNYKNQNYNVVVGVAKKGEQAGGKLSFSREERARFDLHDLLRASAEILGSGAFGSSYKAMILCDAVVVKRYKQMNNFGREEFHQHMRRLGRLSHPNLLPLVAYYYRKDEKLLIYDFVHNGSLASHLHGKHNVEEAGLDWPTRLRIIKGIARGLSYLHQSLPTVIVAHGHLKSSNVLLNESMDPLVTDYGIVPVTNQEQAQHLMMAYKSPEYAKHGRITKKTDVWSLGIVILEMLTGKFPENYVKERYDCKADIGSWVNEMVKEKRTGEVFDEEMGVGWRGNKKGEMLKMLKIGLSCCEEDVERRLDLNEVVVKIEELDAAGSQNDDGKIGDFNYSKANNIMVATEKDNASERM